MRAMICTACGDVATHDLTLTTRSNDKLAYTARLCPDCYRTILNVLSSVKRRSGVAPTSAAQ